MPRHWGQRGTGWEPAPWDTNSEWWSRREGTEAWQHFGRRMAMRLMVGFLALFSLFVALGAFVASALSAAAARRLLAAHHLDAVAIERVAEAEDRPRPLLVDQT